MCTHIGSKYLCRVSRIIADNAFVSLVLFKTNGSAKIWNMLLGSKQSWISGWFKLLLLYLLISSLPSPSIWKCQIKAVAHQFPPTPAMLILMNSDVLRLLGIRGQNLIIFLLRIRISDCLIGHWVKAGHIRILDETFLWYFFIVEPKVNNCSQCYSCQSISNSELKLRHHCHSWNFNI